jgi:hypothetical protein
MKPCRYYEIIDGFAHVYDSPYSSKALSVSIVSASDLAYYRANFTLTKIWGVTPANI